MKTLSWLDCPVLAGSCPNLMMNTNDTLEPKMGSTTSPWSQSPTKAHRALCLSLSSDGTRQDEDMISHHQNLGDQVSDGLEMPYYHRGYDIYLRIHGMVEGQVGCH